MPLTTNAERTNLPPFGSDSWKSLERAPVRESEFVNAFNHKCRENRTGFS